MLKIHTLPLGAYQTNTYIVHNSDSRECVIIDPGYHAHVILKELEKLELKPAAILLTHGHFDHVGAVAEIVKATGCKLHMHKGDWERPRDPLNRYFYPIAGRDFAEMQFCGEGDELTLAGLTFTVLATPGHTPGSVCYLCEDALFSGDTLFEEGCGRTDLPGGDWSTIQTSLGRLAEMEDCTVFPGHGGSTTLAYEKRYNPHM